jgi:hypothetical protein
VCVCVIIYKNITRAGAGANGLVSNNVLSSTGMAILVASPFCHATIVQVFKGLDSAFSVGDGLFKISDKRVKQKSV